MSLTVKQLKKFLRGYRDDAVIETPYHDDFVHIVSTEEGNMVMSTTKPIGKCNRCGSTVYETLILEECDGYVGYCPAHDEDLVEREFTRDE